jgi:hypothetical protein
MLTRGAQVTGIAVLGLSLTWISSFARMYVRTRMLKFVGKEDWLTAAAVVCFPTCALELSPVPSALLERLYQSSTRLFR